MRPQRADLLQALVEVADLLLTDMETQVLLHRMAGAVTTSIPDVAGASVTLGTGKAGTKGYQMVAASGELAERIDDVQYTNDAGPCVEALRTGNEVIVPQLPADSWPAFSAAAQAEQVNWSMSVPMRNGEHVGVLNIYGLGEGRYDPEQHLRPATVFARYAATILAAHSRFQQATGEVGQLREAMASRAVIEQAKGMIMLLRRCSPDEAFEVLVHTSQHSHLKLRDVAAQLIASVMD